VYCKSFVYSAVALLLVASAVSQTAITVVLRIADQHGSSISEAKVTLTGGGRTNTRSSDASGGAAFFGLRPGSYRLTVDKPGFYTQSKDLDLTSVRNVIEVELIPVREYEEDVEVTARASPVDPQQTSISDSLSGRDVLNIPYPTTRDYRNVIPYIPGVVSNVPGDLHIAGASTQESAMFLDGFEVSQPAAGSLQLRVSPDALRLLEVESSRYSAQFGKSAGGILNVETQDADNHFRWNAVNFIPSFQNVKGLHFDSWTPRAYVSGPIVKNKLWYYVAHLQENNLNIIEELPEGQDSSRLWRTDDLVKLLWMPDTRHSISASAVANISDTDHYGISKFDPVSTTTNQYFRNLFVGLRDQIKIGQLNLLDIGIAYQTFADTSLPLGTAPYVFTPEGRTGNFFEASRAESRRAQQHANLFIRPLAAVGTHQISAGVTAAELAYGQTFERNDILFTDGSGSVVRQVIFGETPHFRQTVNELSLHVQDRWLITSRAMLEAGLRWDHDDLLDSGRWSSRFAASYVLIPGQELKVSAGWGQYTARGNLDQLTRSLQGTRTDLFFVPGSSVPVATQSMAFASNSAVHLPQASNWSVGIQSRLFSHFYGGVEYLSRNMNDGLGYIPAQDGVLLLTNDRTEQYRSIQFRFEGQFAEDHRFVMAYTRSRGLTNQVLDYSIENPVFGPQVSGRLPWDAPNQLVAWGTFPSFKWKSIDFAYSLLWRSGLPFITVNSRDQLVQTNNRRLPDFFSLNPAVEKKFSLKSYRLALRIGIDNITNSENAVSVNNNIDSPTFLETFGRRHRTLNARIRLLGRK
jgi:hypothetical protein